MKLNITISHTAQGDRNYIQIISDDSFSVNIVLVADKHGVQIVDRRAPRPRASKSKKEAKR